MSKNSLRKAQKFNKAEIEKVSKNLHLVAGKHEHTVNHSHSPMSASEIERLYAINPNYVDKLLNIIETGLENDKKDREAFYKAVDKEQENDKLAIQGDISAKKTSMYIAGGIVSAFLITSLVFLLQGEPEIAGGIITIGLIGVVSAIFSRSKDKKES